MHLCHKVLLVVVLVSLAGYGCGAKPAVDSPATRDAVVADGTDSAATPIANVPSASTNTKSGTPQPQKTSPPPTTGNTRTGNVKAPAKPTAEQIAKWGVPDFQPLRLLACSDGFGDPAVLCMAISPDGKQFVLGGAKLTLWNTKDSQPTVELLAPYKSNEVERPLSAMAISADGKWLAAGDQNGMVRVWTLSDQREAVAIKAHDGHLRQLAFSPDSRLLATTTYSGEVHLWQIPEGKKLKSLQMSKQEIRRLEFLSDNLLVSASSEVNIWNIESGKKESTLTAAYVRDPALGLSNDRRWLAFDDQESVIQFWDVQNSKSTGLELRGAGAHLIAFSHDGKCIATY